MNWQRYSLASMLHRRWALTSSTIPPHWASTLTKIHLEEDSDKRCLRETKFFRHDSENWETIDTSVSGFIHYEDGGANNREGHSRSHSSFQSILHSSTYDTNVRTQPTQRQITRNGWARGEWTCGPNAHRNRFYTTFTHSEHAWSARQAEALAPPGTSKLDTGREPRNKV